MLSVILYGRNDNYGYNLHKRAALSLNCMAEVLSTHGDEILFVDYNTPDDYPTFPEAIRDTLTRRARCLLRVLRVRPAQHARFRERTRLAALEPIARNVALRRSNPENRWVLSTNTDMIFVPRSARSLSEIAADLDEGLYHIPRFEVPETLWESLDRMDPAGTIAEIGRWGWDLHLNEIVYGSSMILYDGPGDFQLATRSDLFRIHGFDERMLLGWHVDSNLARRLGSRHGLPRSLVDHLFGYHCDHTRQVTPMHRHDRVQNDWKRFVEDLPDAEIVQQEEGWGLAAEPIEEIRLEGGIGHYVGSLRAAIGDRMLAATEIAYNQSSYGKVDYDPRHVVPFLVDALSCYPRATTIGWIGAERSLLAVFAVAWRRLGFTGEVMIPAEADWLDAALAVGCRPAHRSDMARGAAVFVIDFGQPRRADDPSATTLEARRIPRSVGVWFRKMVTAERARLEQDGAAPRRFVAVNSVHGPFESLVRSHIGAALAPIATRLRQGFVLPERPEAQQLLAKLDVGPAGRREEGSVAVLGGIEGYVIFGGYLDLLPGQYRVRVAVAADGLAGTPMASDLMILDIVAGHYYLGFRPVKGEDVARGEVTLDFTVSDELLFYLTSVKIEVRLRTRGYVAARIAGVTLQELPDGASPPPAAALDWLPLMSVGNAGSPPRPPSRWLRPSRQREPVRLEGAPLSATAAGVLAREGVRGCVVFGPDTTLLPGRHLLEVGLGASPKDRHRARVETGQINLDVYCCSDGTLLAEAAVAARQLGDGPARLEFTVPDRPDRNGNPMRLEFRVWSTGEIGFMVSEVRAQPVALLPIERVAEQPCTAAFAGGN